MNKIIILLTMLSILIIAGCSDYDSTIQPQAPAVGGGCGVSTQNTDKTDEYVIKIIPIQGAF